MYNSGGYSNSRGEYTCNSLKYTDDSGEYTYCTTEENIRTSMENILKRTENILKTKELFYRAPLLDMDSNSQDKEFTEDSELGFLYQCSYPVCMYSMYIICSIFSVTKCLDGSFLLINIIINPTTLLASCCKSYQERLTLAHSIHPRYILHFSGRRLGPFNGLDKGSMHEAEHCSNLFPEKNKDMDVHVSISCKGSGSV
jgi:hypothetical protein